MKEMKKYYIVPKETEILVSGTDKEDAICNFATTMDLDMHTYFSVLTEEEYQAYCEAKSDAAAYKSHVIRFMKNELIETFEMPEQDAEDVAENAYAIYEQGNGQTEYECIEEAYDDWLENASA